MKCGDEFLKGHHLVPVRRRRYENQRIHAGSVPGFDAFTHVGGGAVQREMLAMLVPKGISWVTKARASHIPMPSLTLVQ